MNTDPTAARGNYHVCPSPLPPPPLRFYDRALPRSTAGVDPLFGPDNIDVYKIQTHQSVTKRLISPGHRLIRRRSVPKLLKSPSSRALRLTIKPQQFALSGGFKVIDASRKVEEERLPRYRQDA